MIINNIFSGLLLYTHVLSNSQRPTLMPARHSTLSDLSGDIDAVAALAFFVEQSFAKSEAAKSKREWERRGLIPGHGHGEMADT